MGEPEPLAAGDAPFSLSMPDRRGCSVGEVMEDLSIQLNAGAASRGRETFLYKGENAFSIFR